MIRSTVASVSCFIAATSVAVCYSPDFLDLVDAKIGVARFSAISLGWLGVHLLTFRDKYRTTFER